MVNVPEYWHGQSPKIRKQIAMAFIAKAGSVSLISMVEMPWIFLFVSIKNKPIL